MLNYVKYFFYICPQNFARSLPTDFSVSISKTQIPEKK